MLEIDNLTFAYGETTVLKEIHLQVEKPQVFSILGPNASGKSTLFRLAAGLLEPQGGCVRIDGDGVLELAPKDRARRIGILPQGRKTPQMAVEELVAHGRYPHLSRRHILTAQDQEIIEHALEVTGLADLRHRQLPRLSGGQRQKAYLAMVIAQDPDYLLLDEPTTYLDVHVQYELMALVQKLKQQGKTAVLVMHDLPLALQYSDRIAVLHEGALQAGGTPEEVVSSGVFERVFHVSVEQHRDTYYTLPLTAVT
ncbi:MAG: ABC transporter ATP-binding protein [Clostridiales bacterium]|nr:ABC transporter ATP-binding protein [Clostridiales bacterium]